MPWTAPPPAPRCGCGCGSSVFAAESFMAADRTPFRLACLKCGDCGKKLTAGKIAEHDKKLFCHPCHQKLFCPQDSAPVKSVMQVLPIQGMFIVEPKAAKEEFLSEEELRKREEAAAAARAWQEATGTGDKKESTTRIMETVSIAPDDSISI